MKSNQLFYLLLLFVLTLGTSCGGDDDTMEEELTTESLCKYAMEFDEQLIEKELSNEPTGMICNVAIFNAGDGIGYGTSLFSNDSDEELRFFRGTINIPFNELPTTEQFDSLFHVGTYDYTLEGDMGTLIEYTSPDNEVWSTDRGTGNQAGSSFELLEKVSETLPTGYTIIARVKYNCTLYNDAGEAKDCEGTATIQVLAFN